jgi:transcriptional regulator with XRE-family HTH domain
MKFPEVGHRIKLLREALRVSQREFCKLLSLSGGYIANIEANLREPNDRLIKLIVSEFNVNEEWLLTGNGQIFDIKVKDERSSRLLSLFNNLPKKYQDVVFDLIDSLYKADEKSSSVDDLKDKKKKKGSL